MNTATTIETDIEGFLVNHKEWSLAFLKEAADEDEIILTDNHIDLVICMREYYEDFGVAPPPRALNKKLKVKLGKEINSDYIKTLFPFGIKQAAKFAGLPKPTGCFS